MRKIFVTTATSFLLLSLGAAFAQKTSAANSYGGPTGTRATASVNHQVLVHVPTVVILKLNGTSGQYSVSFTPSATDMEAAASGTGSPLSPDSLSPFVSLEGFTNSTSAVDVSVGIAAASGNPASSTTIMNDIMLGSNYITNVNGTPASLSIPAASGTPGWHTLIDGNTNKFQLKLGGTEVPGDYTYTVTYSAAVP